MLLSVIELVFLAEGSYGEYVVIPSARAIPLPKALTLQQGCAALLQGFTAHYLVTGSYPLKEGDTALIHAGAGGCGQILIQMAKLRGARVITTVGSQSKVEIARAAGADECIIYTETDFVTQVKALTNDRGVNVVYDSVGKDTFQGSLKCLAKLGHFVSFGSASGKVPPIDPMDLCLAGSITFIRPSLNDYVATPAALASRAQDVFQWIMQGKVKLSIGRTFPLHEASDAHRFIESRQSTGKILLIVDPQLA